MMKHFDSVRHLSSRELDESLRQYAVERVRTVWDRFRRDEDEKLEAAFHQICTRFSGKINATVDELYEPAQSL